MVDVAGDKVVEAAGAGLDTVESAISYTLGNNLELQGADGAQEECAGGEILKNLDRTFFT